MIAVRLVADDRARGVRHVYADRAEAVRVRLVRADGTNA